MRLLSNPFLNPAVDIPSPVLDDEEGVDESVRRLCMGRGASSGGGGYIVPLKYEMTRRNVVEL